MSQVTWGIPVGELVSYGSLSPFLGLREDKGRQREKRLLRDAWRQSVGPCSAYRARLTSTGRLSARKHDYFKLEGWVC